MRKKVLIPIVLSVAALFYLPNIFYSPGYALVTTCLPVKVGPNAPQATLPPECAGSGGNQQVVALAKAQLGDPYVWGAPARNWASLSDNPPSFDCSGLVGWAWYKGSGGKVSMSGQTSADWNDTSGKYQKFTKDQIGQIQPGDLIYFTGSNIHHVGMYVGQGGCGAADCFIHAPQTGDVVKESSLSQRNAGSDPMVGFLRPVMQ